MPVARFMALCLGHPTLGYYPTRDPLGRGGDFTTAPEISQMFGEMIGIWAASLWQQMGQPARLRLVELGPGRGTLMADALRAAWALPAFRAALEAHLVEISPVLRAAQERALAASGVAVAWHRAMTEVPEGTPTIVIANEFFDALPIRQVVFANGAWRERMVGLDAGGALSFGLSAEAAPDVPFAGAEGDLREICPEGRDVVAQLAPRLKRDGGALLAIDYGYARPRPGDSLQAMQGHGFVDPLASPGVADLTAHVDFATLAAMGKAGGLAVHPLLTQHTLLHRLGIAARASALAQSAPSRADEVAAAFRRLTGVEKGQMGTLFKALCLTSPDLSAPPAFDSPDPLMAQITA